jgi:hypothetical protein
VPEPNAGSDAFIVGGAVFSMTKTELHQLVDALPELDAAPYDAALKSLRKLGRKDRERIAS